MSRALPWYRLAAEAESFPIASEASFAWHGLTLQRHDDYGPAGDTRRLSKSFDEHLRTRAEGLSLDALSSLRDRIWSPPLGAPETTIPLHRYVHGIAAEYLGWEGTHVTLRCPAGTTNLPERAAAWRWLTLRAPDDLFVAAIVAPTPHDYPPGHIRLLPPQLERMLQEDGASETHLHLGGALNTSVLWSTLAASLHHGDHDARFEALKELGPVPFGGPVAFLAALRGAMCVRLVLAAFLDARDRGEATDFVAWFARYTEALSSRLVPEREGTLGDALGALVSAFCEGRVPVQDRGQPPSWGRSVYAALLGDTAPRRAFDAEAARGFSLRDLREAPLDRGRRPMIVLEDPLTYGAPREVRARVHIEGALAVGGLRYLAALERSPRPDTPHSLSFTPHSLSFAGCFWQYQRVRGIFHRFLTLEPGTAGLDWFSQHFQRVKTFTRPITAVLPAIALRHASTSLQLASFEGRVAPLAPSGALREALRWFIDGALSISGHNPEVGLLLHFLKSERRRDIPNSPRYADPAGDVRYRRWYRERLPELAALRALLDQTPESLVVLRGLDVASRELTLPTWVIATVLNAGREASRHAAATLARRRPDWDVPPLRVTVHAGEDFRRLSDGLRRVGELLRYGCVGVGDRIGHGIALGTDPARWAQRFAEMTQPREERLYDLLWELELYDDGSLPGDGARVASARAEARQHIRAIFEAAGGDALPTIEDLIEIRQLLHGPVGTEVLSPATDGLEVPLCVPKRLRATLKLLLTHREVYLRCATPIRVMATEAEVGALRAMQDHLRALLARLEITVETNPSSNLLIADLEDLRDHPAMRLAPLEDPTGLQSPAVLLSLNSDDPVTFATSLADEYAHMYFALLHAKVPSMKALRWLDALRHNGWRSRFTLPISRKRDVLLDVYEHLLPADVPRSAG